MWETWVRSLGREDPLEKEMATHSSTLAWRIPWMEEPGGLKSMGSQRVGHDWATSLFFSLSPLQSHSSAVIYQMLPGFSPSSFCFQIFPCCSDSWEPPCCVSLSFIFSMRNFLTRCHHFEQLGGSLSYMFLCIHPSLPQRSPSPVGFRIKPCANHWMHKWLNFSKVIQIKFFFFFF